jgi:4-hydroxybenzoate polyprenyltransferase
VIRSVALRLGRVSNLPTVWTNVLAGIVLAGGDAADPRFAVSALSMSLLYVAGMYLNDAFDREFDARERPERPIPSGQVGAGTVFAAGFAMLFAGIALLAVTGAGGRATAAACALAATIVFYDWHHKGNRLSPLVMGLCRVLVYVTAALTVSLVLPPRIWVAAAVVLSYLIGLTYVAKQETLRRVDNLWPLAFLAVPVAYGIALIASVVAVAIPLVLFVGWMIYALSLLVRRKGADVPRAVVSLIAGISLLDALIVAGAGEAQLVPVAVACFLLTLALQRSVPGT